MLPKLKLISTRILGVQVIRNNASTKTLFNIPIGNANESDVLSEELQKAAHFTNAEWDDLRRKLVTREIRLKNKSVTQDNVNALIVQYCAFGRLESVSKSFFKYLITKNESVHPIALLKFLTSLSNSVIVAKENKEVLCYLVNELMKTYKPHTIINEYISGLCFFEEYWEEVLKMLVDGCENPETRLSKSTFEKMLEAAFSLNKVEDSWVIWKKMLLCYPGHLEPSGCYEFFSYCHQSVDQGRFSSKLLEDFFEFCCTEELCFPTITVAKKLEELIDHINSSHLDKNHIWVMKHISINIENGVCESCNAKLKPYVLLDDEFENLKSLMFKNLILSTDVYIRSNPQEVERFEKFLPSAKPYDVVIDSLNLLYKFQRDYSRGVNLLKDVVKYFEGRSLKAIIIGRQHLHKMLQKDDILQRCHAFLVDNMSKDDSFLLTAALHGGKNTCIVTSDYLRSEKWLMKYPSLQRSFMKWQNARQYVIGFGVRTMQSPCPYQTWAQNSTRSDLQKDEHTWHIPYEDIDEFSRVSPVKFGLPGCWLCVSRLRRGS